MSDTNGSQDRARIHFVSVEVQNHMRVRRAKVFLPERGVVPIVGGNRNGKTSFKRSLAALVGGDAEVELAARNSDAPEDEEAYIVGVLSNGTTLRRTFTGAASAPKGRLTAKDSENRQLSQAHLSAIVGPRAIEPMRFFDKRGPEQREALMRFAPELAEALSTINSQKTDLEEERRPFNSQIQVLGRIQQPAGERPTPVDVSGEMAKLREFQAAERERQDLVRRAARLLEDRNAATNAVQVAVDRVKQLERQLTEARDELEARQNQAEASAAAVEKAERAAQDAPDVAADIEAVQTRISEADAVNARLEPWKQWERAQTQLEECRAESKRITAELQELEAKKREAIGAAALPFTGLSFDDAGEILIDGQPVSAASGMEQCRLALEVAIADDPDLGVVFMNGNELDDEALAEIHRLAEQHDFQVIMDIIHSPGFEGEVRMVDGVAHQEDVPEPAEVA